MTDNTTIYTASNVNAYLDPLPVTDMQGLPYNLPSTPLLGTPSSTLSADFLSYYNGTGNFAGAGIVQKMADNESILYLPIGNENGYRGEVTDAFVANQWQTFFYVFQPFVTDDFFNITRDSLEDQGLEYSNVSYYTQLFEQNFAAWMTHRRSHTDADATSFRSFLNNQTDMGYRQRSVVFWQFSKIIDMLFLLQERTLNAAGRQIIWNNGAKKAVDTMISRNIPAIRPSEEDVRVPDPDSIDEQHNVMMDLERDRANQRISEDKARTDDSITSFSADGLSQQKATMQSFWNSLSTVLNSILN